MSGSGVWISARRGAAAWCRLGGDARIICYDNDPVTSMGGYWERNWWPKLSLSAFVSHPKSKSKIGTVKNGQKYPRSRRARNGTEVRGPDLGRVIDGSQFEVVVIYVGTRNNVLIISQVIRLLQNCWQIWYSSSHIHRQIIEVTSKPRLLGYHITSV